MILAFHAIRGCEMQDEPDDELQVAADKDQSPVTAAWKHRILGASLTVIWLCTDFGGYHRHNLFFFSFSFFFLFFFVAVSEAGDPAINAGSLTGSKGGSIRNRDFCFYHANNEATGRLIA
ncbi:hypothetical protein BJX61DRAFT_275536 [Aspergillus egyptiacus]|nr:hypothetical protein BJX61DRAFT_275536 [Aspergillus egyptiacus]